LGNNFGNRWLYYYLCMLNRIKVYMNRVKYLYKTVISLFILLFTLCGTVTAQNNLTKIKTVCIDAGHGGKDPGAVGSSSQEKKIALSIALKLGKLIENNYPDVKVVYTRKSDVFIDLRKRSQIANDCNADLFISIHLNSAEDRNARGIETLVLGSNSSEQNMRTAMRENSALKYESDYSVIRETFDPTKPESYIIFNLIRNVHLNESLLFASLAQEGMVGTTGWRDRKVKQQPVWVLKDASMPAVLVEVGFISNPTEERALKSESTQNSLAKSLLKSFGEYKKRMESNNSVLQVEPINKTKEEKVVVAEKQNVTEKKETPEESPKVTVKETPKVTEQPKTEKKPVSLENVKQDDWFYAVQIGSLTEPVKSSSVFGVSETVYCLADGNRYKYYICKSKSYDEVAKSAARIKTKIKGAFVIGVKAGKIANVAELREIEKR